MLLPIYTCQVVHDCTRFEKFRTRIGVFDVRNLEAVLPLFELLPLGGASWARVLRVGDLQFAQNLLHQDHKWGGLEAPERKRLGNGFLARGRPRFVRRAQQVARNEPDAIQKKVVADGESKWDVLGSGAVVFEEVLDDLVRLVHLCPCVWIHHERELALATFFHRLWPPSCTARGTRLEQNVELKHAYCNPNLSAEGTTLELVNLNGLLRPLQLGCLVCFLLGRDVKRIPMPKRAQKAR
mmetsp:Transcript_985/g.2293  ORF Transcript_985/g.2293 Transcript_985/m.2293 type:complete len:239 (+) Transcript_985:77-793(+)